MAKEFRKSTCVQKNISNTNDALTIFSSTDTRTGEIPLVLVPRHRSPFTNPGDWWVFVPTGCYCLAQWFGKDVGKAEAGMSFHLPGYRIAYMVTQQNCNYNAPVKECPTSDNVRVGVDVVVVFSIRNPEKFIYNLGAVHFDHLLSGAVDEGIRLLVREQSHSTVKYLRGSRSEELLKSLNAKFEACGVNFSSCQITSVYLPRSLDDCLENTTAMKKAMEKSTREQALEMKSIEQKSEIDIRLLERQLEEAKVKEGGKKTQAELRHKSALVKAHETRGVAEIEATEKAQVDQMKLNSQLQRTATELNKQRVERMSKVEAAVEARRAKADNEYFKVLTEAEAEKTQLLGEAESLKLDAEAEANTSAHLVHKRKFELEMAEKDAILQLAQKADFNLIGAPADALITAVTTGKLGEGGDLLAGA
eukprot:TRINITY_DN55565_c0_g1_i1.p1 TRINITY_DN55565_c0_g1~~TRINITY_DN55565_c0_g1_i1.p1  ORF type:complete len:420 (-),score=114.88 TRINITY_DN55565_c0_g1_i1:186-1445(-)